MIKRFCEAFIFGLILSLFFFPGKALAQNRDTVKVLFVGNSYTYIWNMPLMLEELARTQKKIFRVKKSTIGGAYWREHWNNERGLKTIDRIREEKWDYVVLQNNSLSSVQNIDSFMIYGKKLIQLIKEEGAKPLLFMIWARESNPLMQATIENAYKNLGRETGVEVIDVGTIWMKARDIRPDLGLYLKDGSHPSVLGSYLIANIFYAALTGEKTKSIERRVYSVDKYNEMLFLAIVEQGDADFIHQLIDEYFMEKNLKP